MRGLFRTKPRAPVLDLSAALDESWARIDFTPDGTILEANARFQKATGYTRDELVGKHHSMLCPPEVSQSDHYKTFWSGLAVGETKVGRFKRRGKDGGTLYLRASYMPVRDADGKIVRIVKIAADVTQDAEDELDARGKLDSISRVQAIIEFDVDGTIITANENFLGAVGYKLSEIEGKHHRIFMPAGEADTPEYRELWAALQRGEFISREFRRRAKDGSEIWIAASYNAVKDKYGKVRRIVKFASDITPRVRSVEALGAALGRLAEGDLTFTLDTPLEAAYEPLRVDTNRLVEGYRNMIARVNDAMEELRDNSGRIKDGATGLSERAERQAATLEQIAATIEELSGAIASTAKNSRLGSETAAGAAARTREGQEVIEKATAAVRTIEESSRKINEINNVIESIAFQTNLLALNAAVEAARAGEAGKGFAVVAAEVRTLAQRSSDAAADTTRLIKESAANVEQGARMMAAAVEVFSDIRTRVDSLARSITDIETANSEQSAGVNEINQAVAELDSTTQGNAEASTENAAAARSFDSELADLAEMLTFFRTTVSAMRRAA